jgi:hypothetical protein
MRRAIRTSTLFTSGETSLSVIVAMAAIVEGALACSVLLIVLQHRSSSVVAARQGVTSIEWAALGAVVLTILGITVLLSGALSHRLISFLRGEPVGALRCWGHAVQASLSLLRICLSRWMVALATRPRRRDRTAGGFSLLFGRAFGSRLLVRGAFALPLFVGEQLKGANRKRRADALLSVVGQRRAVLDAPSTLATAWVLAVLGIATAGAWNASVFLGLVVGILGLILACNALALFTAICSIALYIYLTNDAPTLGFQADDLRAMVIPPPRISRRHRR